MSCWCSRLHADEIKAVELLLGLGGAVASVQIGKYPELIGGPCAAHGGAVSTRVRRDVCHSCGAVIDRRSYTQCCGAPS